MLIDSGTASTANRRHVRVTDLSAAKHHVGKKQNALRAKMDAKAQPLMDARMRLESDVMRNMLDLNAEVKTAARRRPELLDAFASLADFCSRGGRSSGDGGGGTPPATT